jgi:hypothetical protein
MRVCAGRHVEMSEEGGQMKARVEQHVERDARGVWSHESVGGTARRDVRGVWPSEGACGACRPYAAAGRRCCPCVPSGTVAAGGRRWRVAGLGAWAPWAGFGWGRGAERRILAWGRGHLHASYGTHTHPQCGMGVWGTANQSKPSLTKPWARAYRGHTRGCAHTYKSQQDSRTPSLPMAQRRAALGQPS